VQANAFVGMWGGADEYADAKVMEHVFKSGL
jgi:hypothetical protein